MAGGTFSSVAGRAVLAGPGADAPTRTQRHKAAGPAQDGEGIMEKEIRDRWVAALRSGEYEQGTGWLRSRSGRFCCLGVLCDVLGFDLQETGWGEEGGTGSAPRILTDLLDYNTRLALANANDDDYDFNEMAELIVQTVPVS